MECNCKQLDSEKTPILHITMFLAQSFPNSVNWAAMASTGSLAVRPSVFLASMYPASIYETYVVLH